MPTPQLCRAHSCRVPSCAALAWPQPAPPSRAAGHHWRGRGQAAPTGHSVMCLEMDNPVVAAPGGTPTGRCPPSRPEDTALGSRGLGLQGWPQPDGQEALGPGSGLSAVTGFPQTPPCPPGHTPPPQRQGTCPAQPEVSAAGGPACAGMCAVTFGGLLLNRSQTATRRGSE